MNEQQPQPPYYPSPYQEEDEISLKELILKVQEYAREVIRLWWVVILITIPIVGYMLYQAYKTPITYNAPLTFMLNEDSGGSLGGVSAILGQFGFGRGKSTKFNLEKMLELSRSRRIIQLALFKKIELSGQKDFIANHIIKEYNYHEKWKKNKVGLADFLFTHDNIPTFNRIENTVLKLLHGKIIGGKNIPGLVRASINEETGIVTMTGSTTNEDLSIDLVKIIYNNLSDFYINKSTERQNKTFNIIKNKTDSLQNILNSTQVRLLRFQDTNKGLTLQRYTAEKIRIQQEIQKLILAYGESYKQLEIADFALQNETPVIQIIDLPIHPIKRKGESKIRAILTGLMMSFILGILVILGSKIIRDAINS